MTLLAQPLPCVGSNLSRPESVIATADGRLYATDRSCGVVRVLPTQCAPVPLQIPVEGFMPNGIALLPDGSFLIANIGPTGGVWRLTAPGVVEPYITSLEGQKLYPTNFVELDRQGRIWFTVSTRHLPRELAFRAGIRDGFVACHEGGTSRVVADHIEFCNEGRVSPDGQWFYVNETIGRRVTRFPILPEGGLGTRETFHQFDGCGIFPDGLAFDAEGGVWVASVVSNRLIRIKDGAAVVVLEDCDDECVRDVEQSFSEGRLVRAHIDLGAQWSLGNISSLAFAGRDLKTIYLGSLFRKGLTQLKSDVAGAPPVHWNFGPTVLD